MSVLRLLISVAIAANYDLAHFARDGPATCNLQFQWQMIEISLRTTVNEGYCDAAR